jgi:hypothetical protein
MTNKTLAILLIAIVVSMAGTFLVVFQNVPFDQTPREHEITSILQNETTLSTPHDIEHLEKLALQNPTVANFAKGIDFDVECCTRTKINNSSLVTLYLLDNDNQRQLSVTFDSHSLQILDIDNFRPIYHTPVPSDSYSYRVISLKEFPGKSFYYYKIEKLDSIPHLSDVYENKSKVIPSSQFAELLTLFYHKCINDNPGDTSFCNDTPPAFEFKSKQYLFVSKGVDSITSGEEFIQNELKK